jgi:DNA-binding transcriptional ArsR family regulator
MRKATALPGSARKQTLVKAGPATETVDLSLRLLERLASLREPIGVSELAREFASSKATVYRHLQALVRHGFVHQESATMRYAAGIRRSSLSGHSRERSSISMRVLTETLRSPSARRISSSGAFRGRSKPGPLKRSARQAHCGAP